MNLFFHFEIKPSAKKKKKTLITNINLSYIYNYNPQKNNMYLISLVTILSFF